MGKGPLLATAGLAVALAAMPLAAQANGDDVAPSAALVKSYGPGFDLPNRPSQFGDPATEPGVTEYDLSYGCIIGGVTGTGLSVGVGGLNVINLIAGGIVPATNPVASYLALGGVVFASFCAVGQALTPAFLATYGYFVPPPSRAPLPATELRELRAAVLTQR